jgi:hypothetical protein
MIIILLIVDYLEQVKVITNPTILKLLQIIFLIVLLGLFFHFLFRLDFVLPNMFFITTRSTPTPSRWKH